MTGENFQDFLKRLIGTDEAARCIRKICHVEQLEQPFFGNVTNAEAVALYVYATANGWHTLINSELWSDAPNRDVVLFAEILDATLAKIPPIRGKAATVYRGYSALDLTTFDNHYPLGQVVKFPAFTSASFQASGAFGGNVLFIIRGVICEIDMAILSELSRGGSTFADELQLPRCGQGNAGRREQRGPTRRRA